MNRLKEFIISYGGLKLGNHTFEYDVDDKFFACFEESELSRSLVHIAVSMEKTERMLVFNFLLDGFVEVVCDRCAGEFDLKVNGEETLIVKFGEEAIEEDDNVLVLPHEETRIDLSGVIYDYINLSIPFRRIHPENDDGTSGCDPEMLERIEALKPAEPTDQRWDLLKNINPEN